jgi:hypothetical protein
MVAFHITPENCEELCGAGLDVFEYGGERRILNAKGRDFTFGGLCMGAAADESFLIPRDQWPDLIADKDRSRSWLQDLCDDLGIPCKNQDGLGYCHGYGPVTAYEVCDAIAGNPYIDYSAESVAGRVVGWQNRGGDPEEDLQVLINEGCCPASWMDKPNSLAHGRWKTGWEQEALKHRAVEYYIPKSKLWDWACTCALRNLPTSPWYNWWGHCISGSYRLKNENGKIYRLDRNNWGMGWGDRGYCWFAEGSSRGLGTPSGLVVVRVATPS